MSTSLSQELRSELEAWEAAGLRRDLALPQGRDFTSNDYLALSRDPRVVAAAGKALEEWGAGAPAARLLRGSYPPHLEAERAAARWLGSEAALLFPSGWQANQALLTTLAGADDVIFSDALNHASLIDGCRLSRATTVVFSHSDLGQLDRLLASHAGARRRLVAIEDVYSMDGDLSPLEDHVALAERHDAWLVLDSAHAAGLYPHRLAMNHRVLARMVTGGKALGVSGGFVCASQDVIDLLINRGRSFVFTTATSPATAAALVAAIGILAAEPERAQQAHAAARRLRQALRDKGIEARGESPIVPVVLGDEGRAMRVAESVRGQGFDVRAVRPPTVPAGTSRLRVVCHSDHTDVEVDALAAAIARACAEEPEAASAAAAAPAAGPPPSPLVVCGTDTEVGKTVVSALLVRAALRQGHETRYLKPVQTGDDSDTETVRSLAGLGPDQAGDPVRELALPASVDQAAEAEGTSVTVAEVLSGISSRVGDHPGATWILECAGGLRVPFNDDEDQADLLAALRAPVVLVARSGLGTLNHTLLSLEAAARRGLPVRGVVLVGERHEANEGTLRRWLPGVPMVMVPRFETLAPEVLDAWLSQSGAELEELVR